MKAEFIREILAFEEKIKVGKHVRVRFQSGHGNYSGVGILSKKDQRHFVVKLLRPIPHHNSTAKYPVGLALQVPRFLSNRMFWSRFSRIEPLDSGYEYETVEIGETSNA